MRELYTEACEIAEADAEYDGREATVKEIEEAYQRLLDRQLDCADARRKAALESGQ